MRYKIISRSKYGTEVIDTASDLEEAKYLTKEYQMAFGSEYTITYKKWQIWHKLKNYTTKLVNQE